MDLMAWRQKRAGEQFELPSGLVVTLRRVALIDLAEQAASAVPAPLAGLVESLLQRDEVRLTLDDFNKYGAVALMVCRAAFVEPRIEDVPADDALGTDELSMFDRIAVFNWCNGGGRTLRPFRVESEEPVDAVEAV